MKHSRFILFSLLFFNMTVVLSSGDLFAGEDSRFFEKRVAPILEKNCLECHNNNDPQGDLSLETKKVAFKGGESGDTILAGQPEKSVLIDYITGPEPEMPKKSKPLSDEEVGLIHQWIKKGANWPDKMVLQEPHLKKGNWWSFQPIAKVTPPELKPENQKKVSTPIDAFLLERLETKGLTFTEEADRRTLIRRLYFDLTGLPPTPEEINAFVADRSPDSYPKLVEKLLASERYGERWARHWLDTVHYADTHGYDKDKLRHHAWPYRDYVIRSFNQDKKYSDFVMEQIAGDVIKPGDPTGIAAVGFLATGPFDWVGHIEINEELIEKKITRNLDRDDMVSVTINTFQSVTVQCARCHNHKFDPIMQEDYYKQQAVFSAIDRADRQYDSDPAVAKKRIEWTKYKKTINQRHQEILAGINRRSDGEISRLDQEIKNLKSGKMSQNAAFGYHSQIENSDSVKKWVQLDLRNSTSVKEIVLIPAYDTYNNIGEGFGFPIRYIVESSNDPNFKIGVKTLFNRSGSDQKSPGASPVIIEIPSDDFRYIRMTATKLAGRKDDFIFALGEIQIKDNAGNNIAKNAKVTATDSIESPPRWKKTNLIDGLYYTFDSLETKKRMEELTRKRNSLFQKSTTREERAQLEKLDFELAKVEHSLKSLPSQETVFTVTTDFKSIGNFKPTGGKPRPIFLLHRGSEAHPIREVGPAGLNLISEVSPDFQLDQDHPEGERRLALAKWIIDQKNALTWRSIVNRIWQFHFGQGIVTSPNDFGRMGTPPSHPELLDYLAMNFRDHGQSIKDLHRMILLSTAYRQASTHNAKAAAIDGNNQFLWRMNRRKLDAESLRDSVLSVSGKMNLKMYGPGYHLFEVEKPQHSPHYLYEKYNPNDKSTHRRSVYRFVVRSVPDPFMDSLDCANPSQMVPKRMQTLTALQALSLMNDKFMVSMASNFASRLEKEAGSLDEQLIKACQLCFGRDPSVEELELLKTISKNHGLENACRLLLNTNEFMFVD